jgi:hypothetical protein
MPILTSAPVLFPKSAGSFGPRVSRPASPRKRSAVGSTIYGEELDLRALGKLQITRASHVEPDAEGYWWADMGPSGGPVLGPYVSRSEALGAERGWLMLGSRA